VRDHDFCSGCIARFTAADVLLKRIFHDHPELKADYVAKYDRSTWAAGYGIPKTLEEQAALGVL
jgi:hypothetical protein